MIKIFTISKPAVALVFVIVTIFSSLSEGKSVFAQSTQELSVLDDLFTQLQNPDANDLGKVEEKIWDEWSKSGSDAMNFLLHRGRTAMDEGDLDDAVGHLSALIDHAPDFAEAWNTRATTFFLMGEYGLSISDIKQTLALNPRHFGALSGLARMLEDIGNKKQALTAYQEALKLIPHKDNLKQSVERLTRELEGTAL